MLIIGIFFPFFANSGENIEEQKNDNHRALVKEIMDEGHRFIPGTDLETFYQILKVEILEGPETNSFVKVENNLHRLKVNDSLFLKIVAGQDGENIYIVQEPDRRGYLLFILALFIVAILSIGFYKGARSLISLLLSFIIIIFILLPKLLEGASPVPTTIFFACLIVSLAMYISHGFNRVTHSATLGTAVTLILAGLLSYFSVYAGKFSGFASDEALYLGLQTGGNLDMSGLLLGAIIIGILGILDDVSITQSATVKELHMANPNLSAKEIYNRALTVGKEHMVSLVNTLALAYSGASLPLLLLFSQSSESFGTLLNMEIFATEITRTLIGSIALIFAVPISTLFATLFIVKMKKNID